MRETGNPALHLKPASIAHIEDVLLGVMSQRVVTKLPRDSAMAPTNAEIEVERRQVVSAEKAVVDQRARLYRLRCNDLPTSDAEKRLRDLRERLPSV